MLQTLAGLDAGVKSLSFNPDEQVLASSDFFDKITLWNLDFDFSPEKLLAQVCNCVRDYLENSADVEEDEQHLWDGLDPAVGDHITKSSLTNRASAKLLSQKSSIPPIVM